MAIALTTVTGSAQTGLTTPTYTVTADVAPDVNGKQYAITALGGTQTGVVAHSVASPFTITFWRPKILKILGYLNVNTGQLGAVSMNVYKVVTRKGVIPLAGQAPRNMVITTTFEVPAGADSADPLSVRAAESLHIGALTQQSAGLGDTTNSGII